MLKEIFSYFSSILLIKWGWMKVDQEKEQMGGWVSERGVDRDTEGEKEQAGEGGMKEGTRRWRERDLRMMEETGQK